MRFHRPAGLVALAVFVRKELVQTFRDRRMVALMVLVPLIQLTIFGYAVNMDVSQVALAVADQDATDASRRFAQKIAAPDTFRLMGLYAVGRDAASRLVDGGASVAVTLPRGFGRSELGRSRASVQVLVDGGESVVAVVAANALAQVVSMESQAIFHAALAERMAGLAALQAAAADPLGTDFSSDETFDPALDPTVSTAAAPPTLPEFSFRPRIFYNPTLESRIFMVPGVAASLLLILTTLVTAMGVVREREAGTLEQVMVSPISGALLLLGKTLPYLLIGFMDLVLVVTAGAWLFDVPFRGPVGVVLAGGVLYLASTLAMGLTVSTFSNTQQQAVLGALFLMMPAIVLAGFIAPVDNMPHWMQRLTLADPMRHFVEILRACMLKGSSFRDLARQFVALAALGAFGMGVAILRFRKQVR